MSPARQAPLDLLWRDVGGAAREGCPNGIDCEGGRRGRDRFSASLTAQHLWGQAKQLAISILKLLRWRWQLFKAANEFGSSDKSSIRFLIQAAKVIRDSTRARASITSLENRCRICQQRRAAERRGTSKGALVAA